MAGSSVELRLAEFFASLRPKLRHWSYFVNWPKVTDGATQWEMALSELNALLGSPDFEADFYKLLTRSPSVVAAIPMLAVRDGESSTIFSIIDGTPEDPLRERLFDFSKPADSDEARHMALEFVVKSGLVTLFEEGRVRDLRDYVLGVEAGLDSNGRKNRSGSAMEAVVASYLDGYVESRGFSYLSQATAKRIYDLWKIEVPVDKSQRKFDFAVFDGVRVVLIEVNFYGGGGTKLKATAGEYRDLHSHLSGTQNLSFVWVTDGAGWHTTRRPLEEAFKRMENIWNLSQLYEDRLDSLLTAQV